VRLPQLGIEARLAHAARLAALALGEPMTAGRAPKLASGRDARMRVGVDRGSLRPATDALLAEDLLALHAHTGHERPRIGRKNGVGLAIAAETANGNASGRTTDTIRLAMQPPIKVALVRGVTVLVTPRRPAYFNSLARFFRYSSTARRISSESGAPVLSDSFCSFFICSSLKNRAVRFMTT
jgi:hypothetical protein